MIRYVVLFIVLIATLARAAGAAERADLFRVEIFSDEMLTQKTLEDTQPRLVDIYVAQIETSGSTGCSFRIVASPGFTGVWIADTMPWIHVGTTQTGLSMAYGYCLMGSEIIVKITYQLFGTSSCSSLSTAGMPGWMVDTPICDACFGEYPARIASLAVNCAVATEPMTWGKVKALYRN